MPNQNAFLFLLFISPAIVFLVHLALIRMLRPFKLAMNPLHVGATAIIIAGVLIGVLIQSVMLKNLTHSFAWTWLYAGLVYGGLAFSYFQFFAMTETARRIHILRTLYEDGSLSLAALASRYGAESMLAVRLARMLELGDLKKEGEYYRIQKKLILYVGKIMAGWAKLLGFPPVNDVSGK